MKLETEDLLALVTGQIYPEKRKIWSSLTREEVIRHAVDDAAAILKYCNNLELERVRREQREKQ